MTLSWTRLLAVPLLGLALLGCATPRLDDGGSRAAYAEARHALENRHYGTAIAIYEGLLASEPGHEVAQAAQLEIGHAALRAGQPRRAVAEADTFIARFSASPMAGYAYVLAAVASFEHATRIYQAKGNAPEYEHAYHDAVARLQFALSNFTDFSPGTTLSQMLLELQRYPP